MRGGLDLLAGPLAALAAHRGRLFPFVPVGIGIGIGLWFGWPSEPAAWAYLALAAGVVLCLIAQHWAVVWQPVLILIACILLGGLAAGVRAHWVASPMLEFRYYGPVTGRVVGIDRSQAGALRVTLDRVVLADVAADRQPARVRVSLYGEQRWHEPAPGQTVMLTAHLSAPQGAVEPGAFDFRRMAFFDRLGAVGYARTPLLLWQEAGPGEEIVGRMRSHLSAGVRAAIPGDPGAFAAGVLTGDRSGLSVEAVEALRDSSLAHLLAISGMNMAFLIGFTFGLLRYGLALIPPVALRVDSKKIAAAVSLAVACFYLLLSGSNVATERAFIMVSVMLVAVLLDRKALTLRSVAIAATILLLWQPEALLSPGFQMSFAATVALIVGFRQVNDRLPPGRYPRWVLPVVTVVLSCVIGGMATAPYAAAHFNRFSDYGLLANLLTVPVMGLVVMPAGAVAAICAPFGLAALPLWVMEQGCRWILFVAYRIAEMEGAVTAIPAPPGYVLPMLTLGLVWVLLWPGRARWAGIGVAALAIALWIRADRPVLLVAEGVVGVIGPEGRVMSTPRGGGFTARNWLENDGDLVEPEVAAGRPGLRQGVWGPEFDLGGATGVLLAEGADGTAACRAHAVVVAVGDAPDVAGCTIIDDALLSRTGTMAVDWLDNRLRLTPTEGAARLWSPPVAPDQ